MAISGHDSILRILDRAVQSDHLHHALLFRGPEGVGKFTSAVELATRLICEGHHPRPCGTCRNCRRLGRPFPQHPDVTIFRDLRQPIPVHLHQIRDLCGEAGSPVPDEGDHAPAIWHETLQGLRDDGFLRDCEASPVAGDRLMRITVDSTQKITRATVEKATQNPLRYHLLKQISGSIESGGYDGTLKIEQIREMQSMIAYQPFESRIKIIIIDDAHNMLTPAQNCLLKTLEEPPGEALLILITAQPHMLLPTIRSRCQTVPFHSLPRQTIRAALQSRFGLDDTLAEQVAGQSEGSMNLAVSKDWPAFFQYCGTLDELFDTMEQRRGLVEWTLEVLGRILPDDDRIETRGRLADFTRYLRMLLQRIMSRERNADMTRVFPGGRALRTESIIELLDGVAAIRNAGRFHIDTRLHLHKLLLETLGRQDLM